MTAGTPHLLLLRRLRCQAGAPTELEADSSRRRPGPDPDASAGRTPPPSFAGHCVWALRPGNPGEWCDLGRTDRRRLVAVGGHERETHAATVGRLAGRTHGSQLRLGRRRRSGHPPSRRGPASLGCAASTTGPPAEEMLVLASTRRPLPRRGPCGRRLRSLGVREVSNEFASDLPTVLLDPGTAALTAATLVLGAVVARCGGFLRVTVALAGAVLLGCGVVARLAIHQQTKSSGGCRSTGRPRFPSAFWPGAFRSSSTTGPLHRSPTAPSTSAWHRGTT